MPSQLSMFDPAPALPEGFRYRADVISRAEEAAIVEQVAALPFREFEFHGFTGKRRVVSFGWRYDFGDETLRETTPLPPFLLALRDTAAAFAGMEPARLQQTLVTEYSAGAAIGWHRDKAVFGEVVGVSLQAPCLFRLRRKVGTKWDRASLTAEPRSAYLLSGPSRTEWEHSIPAVAELRYSVTYRNLKRIGAERR